ncbi:MAG: dihydrolipoyl dehydrogenase [Desulfobacterales bacterium]|nr:dihydrolipoyl dehydrogenase [Desulfobacterales bacterium]
MENLHTRKRNWTRWLIILVILVLAALFFTLDLGRYFTLATLKDQQTALMKFYEAHMLLTIGIYMAVYIVMAALSLPGAAVMTLAGGAIFGLLAGTVVVSFASTIGATLAFLAARFLFKDYVQARFKEKLKTINKGIEKDGMFYLFTLRLVPIFPFFVINLAMALTPIRAGMFYGVSQIGMLPGTIVYVNAGTQLAQIESTGGILSPDLILSFVLLGLFPWIAKIFTGFIKRRRVMAAYRKPKSADYNMVVIGGGSAGLVSAYIAATVKAKVALIEKHKMGGDCLNTGCVPSKSLIKSAKIINYTRRARDFGLKSAHADYEFAGIMDRVKGIIQKIEPHDSVERYTELGVDCYTGEARIETPYRVSVNGKTLTTRNIVVATGARPFVPPIPGLDQVDYLTSDTVWQLTELPPRLVVLGGGPIGCEMAQTFSRLGSQVTQVEMAAQIMGREDPNVAEFMREQFESEGIAVLTDHQAKAVEVQNGEKTLLCEHDGQTVRVGFDAILVAVGRKANTGGFGLEELGVTLNPDGTIAVDEYLRTRIPNIFCAGDVAGPYQFTHTAAHQAWFAAVNALFGKFKKFKIDYRVIPWTTFTDPEVARVGLNEVQAMEKGIEYQMTRYDLKELDRAIAESEESGFIKVLTRKKTDKILGVTIVGVHAGDVIAEYVLAMKHGLGLNKILGTIHVYPTLAEANKFAAGEWKKANAPEKLLGWMGKSFKWART